jgi:ABC-2 type transport system permease protein
MWRFRQLLSTLMALTLWTVIFQSQETAFGYTQISMINYVFMVSILQSIILATSLHGLAREIYSGHISMMLLKPHNIFLGFATAELADKARNLIFSLLEAVILYFIFKPDFVVPSLPIMSIFILWALAGAVLHFFITIIFGSIGFWSPDSWGPKFLFFMIVDFTAGKLFPLDILPPVIRKLLFFTPFPYLSYAQTQLFLGRLSPQEIFLSTGALGMWLLGSYWLMMFIWQRGIRSFEATGQ